MKKLFDPEGVFQKVVIFNKKGEILLLQASKKYGIKAGTWDLPGGKVHVNESLEEAIKREVLEETSIALKKVQPVCSDIVKFVSSDGKTRLGVVYFAETKREPKLSFEHSDFKWVKPDDVKKISHAFKPAPEWIAKALYIRKKMR